MRPELLFREEGGRDVPLLVWRLPGAFPTISSGPLGGGLTTRQWVINATVPMDYDRDDPDAHLASMAHDLGLPGPGAGLLTGVDVARVVATHDGGVRVWATVGLGRPIPAAAPQETAARVGTINIVACTPVRLSDAALVNAVATVTEAKVQAMIDLGYAATGTATDAVCVMSSPHGDAEQYGGPRSRWGAPLARAAYEAIMIGGRAFQADPTAWSDR
ncbi:MAG: adenosylcobinamide amidohydrolase [Hamadaea sp.]|nr:adenosylcobinamide amidohydrolase [Hamadaea sp.]